LNGGEKRRCEGGRNSDDRGKSGNKNKGEKKKSESC